MIFKKFHVFEHRRWRQHLTIGLSAILKPLFGVIRKKHPSLIFPYFYYLRQYPSI